MSNIGLKALQVLTGAEEPTNTGAELSEAFLMKIKKINQVADNLQSDNGIVKAKPKQSTQTRKQEQVKKPVLEQTERQPPIKQILESKKKELLGLNKRQVSPDQIMSLLSGNRQNIPLSENRKVQTEYQEFISEAKQIKKEENIIDDTYMSNNTSNQDDIRQMVSEEVTRILFKEVFSKGRLKELMESVFKDVIKEKAKEILFETLKRRKAQIN